MSSSASVAGRRVLVVEDDPFISLDIQEILSSAKFVVVGPAGSLPDALGLAAKSRLDAAVLDVHLRVGTSLPLAEVLQSRRIPFLFLTSDRDLVTRSHRTAPVLDKPFRAAQLLEAVRSLLKMP